MSRQQLLADETQARLEAQKKRFNRLPFAQDGKGRRIGAWLTRILASRPGPDMSQSASKSAQ
ncbi:hypothetical protein [[Erwinia] mediterraneensis]|uniref:hypothetical protein n=1 Tax=[Erwinia] mediterraneensis TaxID=2161819 RepID=UPI00102F30EB|nr:hypothetical protein [[Erwinia] mediterraneensis]